MHVLPSITTTKLFVCVRARTCSGVSALVAQGHQLYHNFCLGLSSCLLELLDGDNEPCFPECLPVACFLLLHVCFIV